MRFNEASKIRKMQAQMQKAASDAVTDMMVIAQNHFTMSFRNQGFDDRGVQAWKPRKRTERSRSGNRAILVGKGSGVLRRSINRKRTGKYTAMIFTDPIVRKYAAVHNDGLRAGRGSGFTMPKRQFIGDSYNMSQKIKRAIDNRLIKAFR